MSTPRQNKALRAVEELTHQLLRRLEPVRGALPRRFSIKVGDNGIRFQDGPAGLTVVDGRFRGLSWDRKEGRWVASFSIWTEEQALENVLGFARTISTPLEEVLDLARRGQVRRLRGRFFAFIDKAKERVKALKKRAAPLLGAGILAPFEGRWTDEIRAGGEARQLGFSIEEEPGVKYYFDPGNLLVVPALGKFVAEGRKVLEEYEREVLEAVEALAKLHDWADRLWKDYPGKTFRMVLPQGGYVILNSLEYVGFGALKKSRVPVSSYSSAKTSELAGLVKVDYETLAKLAGLAETLGANLEGLPRLTPSSQVPVAYELRFGGGLGSIEVRGDRTSVRLDNEIFVASDPEDDTLWIAPHLADFASEVEGYVQKAKVLAEGKVRIKAKIEV